jgi:hypothetical protein
MSEIEVVCYMAILSMLISNIGKWHTKQILLNFLYNVVIEMVFGNFNISTFCRNYTFVFKFAYDWKFDEMLRQLTSKV